MCMTRHRSSSEFISWRGATQFALAALSALEQGHPLNIFLTTHLRAAAIEPAHAQVFITHFFKLAGDWLGAVGHVPRFYVWVLEAPCDKGLHVHILLHVPYDLRARFRRLCRGWVGKAGGRMSDSVLDIRDIRRSAPNARVGDYLSKGLGGIVKYLLKGSAPEFCNEAGIDHCPQGRISGKRIGRSQHLRPPRSERGAGLPAFRSDSPPSMTLEQYIHRHDSNEGVASRAPASTLS